MPGVLINGSGSSTYVVDPSFHRQPNPFCSSPLGLYHLSSTIDSCGLARFLPSNNDEEEEEEQDDDTEGKDDGLELYYSCDEFRMYEFKIRGCPRGKSHDWTECPFAHPGEKARRRDPRRVCYTGSACPDFRKGCCKRGDACDLAHGVFECWLHPSRYRTELCKDGLRCTRPVCFFAHTLSQLRINATSTSSSSLSSSPLSASLSSQFSPHNGSPSSPSYDGSPLRHALSSHFHPHSPPSSPPFHRQSFPLSPRSPLPPPSLPDLLSRHLGQMHIGPVPANDPSPALVPLPPLCHFPSPLCPSRRAGEEDEEEEAEGTEKGVVRVESGWALRAKIYGKLRKDNPLDSSDPNLDWVNDLIN